MTLSIAVCLCACKNNGNSPDEPLVSSDIQNEEQVSSVSIVTDPPITSEEPQTSAEASSEPEEEDLEDTALPEEDLEEIVDEYEYRAFDILKLLNSDKAYAKFTEAVSYDGEYISATDNEIFIDGENKVFISDNTKVIMDGTLATVIDFDSMSFYSYEYDGEEYERVFGYELYSYTPVSASDEDGVYTEVFVVENYGNIITSTWAFKQDGTFTVSDVNELAGSFYVYSFETVSDDISKMDMSIPDGLEEFEE